MIRFGKLGFYSSLIAGLMTFLPACSAQAPDDVQFDTEAVRNLEAAVMEQRMDASAMLVEIGGIISPSGEEHERAQAVAGHMRAIGLSDVTVTDDPNVIGRIPGRSGRAFVFISTLDDLKTVAENQRARNAPPTIEGNRIVGPGTNTSLTTVAMLTAAKALLETGVTPEHDLIFAGVAEEETGLNGMHALYDMYKDKAVAFVDILGDGRSISYGAIGIHWWKVIAEGPAGHTLYGGLPNVNQAIARSVDRIFSLPQPERHADQRTRINIAILDSGSVFNHKPESAWFSLDIRSLDNAVIADIENDVRDILKNVSSETGISLKMEPFHISPGGQIQGARDSRLVQTSAAIARKKLDKEPTLSDAGSSNLNVAIAQGTPAIGLGGERGGQRGFPDEWADIDTMMKTSEHVALLAWFLTMDDNNQGWPGK